MRRETCRLPEERESRRVVAPGLELDRARVGVVPRARASCHILRGPLLSSPSGSQAACIRRQHRHETDRRKRTSTSHGRIVLRRDSATRDSGLGARRSDPGSRRRQFPAPALTHSNICFTDHRPRSGLARGGVGDAPEDQVRARSHGAPHHPLHGRSRQALRPHRDRRSRRAQGARFAAQAEGVDPGCPTSTAWPAKITSSASARTTARRRRWR